MCNIIHYLNFIGKISNNSRSKSHEILNFTSNQKQPIKSDSTAKYSLNDAIIELNKLYDLKGYSLNLITETKEEYVFQVEMQNKTNIYKFNKNTGEVKTSTKFE